MTLTRRTVLQSSTAVAAAALAGVGAGTAEARPRPARAEGAVAPDAFTRLPPGSITAHGWLAGQLRLQLDGLCGRFAETSHFLAMDTCGWVHPELGAWEELPYWLRGYVPLAIATQDATALATCERWIDAILATQEADGFFGPRALRTGLDDGPDFWPYLPLLMALRTWQEYTDDTRIVPFLSRFLRYMADQGESAFDSSWVSVRWGDGIDTARWLHDRTGDAFLAGLVEKMHRFGADWTGIALPTPHNVDISQGFREPAQYAQWTTDGADALTRATYRTYDQVLASHGQFPGGGIAGDENLRPGFGDPRQGFESCGIVEFMASHELLTRITGDPVWADRCEELAFNMLPAALDPQGKAIHYVTSANGVHLDNVRKSDGQFQNSFAMQSFRAGVDQYRCCPHNYGMGWPYFTEELWLAADGGLVAAMYADCEVRAEVGDGVGATVRERTDYPFDETVTLTIGVERPVAFPLRLRVPGWCEAPRLTVNGEAVPVSGGPRYAEIRRTWHDGDEVVLRLPQRTTLRTWSGNHDSVSVDHGPLTYSLRIEERYVRTGGSDPFPEYDVHAASAWNYGLAPDGSFTLRRARGARDGNPFTLEGTPVTLTARARRIPEWTADDEQVVAPLQQSPARSRAAVEEVTLVPMGAARLRITAFPTAAPTGHPWTPEPPYHRILNKHSDKVLAVDGMSTANDARVVQFDNAGTGDHAWQLLPAPGGALRLRNGQSGKYLAVRDSSTADSALAVQYEDTGRPDLLWTREDQGDGWFLLRNAHSGKVLGVHEMATGNSAQVVQYTDNGTEDHLWRLTD
ncbi:MULTISPECIES: RICIN domain-containing protein [Streptomyces]|uniref:RICIN domain-containing protein n=1 Tax=Streptomyces TaxID=1883 RepID=UPI002095792E|nr:MULTISPECIES: RICIN domain-containing protein [Streptomyces]MCO6693542.1 glycoside hydrolase family 127 protein [Streptomyces sp. Vc17.3-30]